MGSNISLVVVERELRVQRDAHIPHVYLRAHLQHTHWSLDTYIHVPVCVGSYMYAFNYVYV